MQRCVSLAIGNVRACVIVEQKLADVLVLDVHGNRQRRVVQVVQLIRIGPFVYQRLDNVHAVLADSFMQQVELVATDAVGVVVQVELKQVKVALGKREFDDRMAVAVDIDVGAQVEKPLAYFGLVGVGGHVDECVATAILGVGVFGCDEPLELVQVAAVYGCENLVFWQFDRMRHLTSEFDWPLNEKSF